MAEESSHARLGSYFDKSTSAVRDYSTRFEKSYGRPALNYCVASFEIYPTTSTFLSIFALLSFLPVVFFIAVSLCMITSVVFVALSSAIITIAIVEFFFISILVCILTILLISSIPLTAITILAYIFARLVVLTHSEGRAGIAEWAAETKGHLTRWPLPSHTHRGPLRYSNGSKHGTHDNDGDGSETSILLVGKSTQPDVSTGDLGPKT